MAKGEMVKLEGLLKKRRFKEAFDEAKGVCDTSGKKQLLRILGRAAYGLRKWEESVRLFQQLSTAFHNDESAKKDLERALGRLTESRTGKYDLAKLVEESEVASDVGNPYVADVADYVGPLQIADIPRKGKGYVASKDIKKGTLLMVHKGFRCKREARECVESGFLNLTASQALDRIEKFGKGQLATDGELRVLTTYFNHSCIVNTLYCAYGDAVFIYAVDDIKQGEELTRAYTDPLGSFLERAVSLRFHCACALCDADRDDERFLRRDQLIEESQQLYSSRYCWHHLIDRRTRLVDMMRATYAGRTDPPTLMYWPLKGLAELYQQFEEYEKAIRCFKRAAGCLDNGQLHMHGPRLYTNVAVCYEHLGNVHMARQYAEKTFQLVRTACGYDEAIFKKVHPKLAHLL